MKLCESLISKTCLSRRIIVVMLTVTGFAADAFAEPTPISSCQVINTSGSYVLTDNLSAADTCLLITGVGVDVTLDLDGFTISAPLAIRASDVSPTSIVVRNGIALGGLSLENAAHVTVEKMIVQGENTSGVGIQAGGMTSLITGNHVRGFSVGIVSNGIISGNITVNNNAEPYGWGIVAQPRSSVINNVSNGNHVGIVVDCPTRVTGNVAIGNYEVDLGLRGCTKDKDVVQLENTFGMINNNYTWEE